MIKILIVDDHPIVRKGLKQLLEEAKDIFVADEAVCGREVLEKVKKNDYDVILLDISLPDISGLEILKELKLEKPEINILILSMHSEEQYAVRTLRSGASGYLTKEKLPEELIMAIRRVAGGKKYISPSIAELLAFNLEEGTKKAAHEVLSDREFRVMCMISAGKTLKDIGEELSLSIKTISTYRSRILTKMNMKNNSEIIRYAIENKLVS